MPNDFSRGTFRDDLTYIIGIIIINNSRII